MGLNRLLHDHQVALMRADAALCDAGTSDFRRQALGLARQIEAFVKPHRPARRPLVPTS